MEAVQRQGEESVLGIDNSSKAIQKRSGAFRHDEWGHFCCGKTARFQEVGGMEIHFKRLMLLNLEDGSIAP